jgi:hypothetical protein
MTPDSEVLDTSLEERGADGILKSREELRRLEAAGKGDTGLARDARHNERVGLAKLGIVAVVVGGVLALIIFH